MKTNEPYRMRVRKINSISDLEREKERLQIEITRKEEGIKYNYQNLVNLLSFRNLIGSLIEELNASSSLVSKVISAGKNLMAKRKKKKKARQEAVVLKKEDKADDPLSTDGK